MDERLVRMCHSNKYSSIEWVVFGSILRWHGNDVDEVFVVLLVAFLIFGNVYFDIEHVIFDLALFAAILGRDMVIVIMKPLFWI